MSVHQHYLRDLGYELRRQAEAVRAEAQAKPDDGFLQGQAHAFYSVVSLMQQQATSFGIPPADLAFDGLDPERDLL